ncbi:MAG: tRNA lysidine(34) synthetase TilS [Candidatus Schekmanbacteria bacterium]|nr:tRNA lysidine(34) synthetase TilS [Candidatus Schekmanbacteria bacterium]
MAPSAPHDRRCGCLVRIERLVAAQFRAAAAGGDFHAVVGLSGGPDSVLLACAAVRLARGEGFADPWPGLQLTAAHVVHGVRPVGSAADERFCRDLAARLGLELRVVDVSAEIAAAGREGGSEDRWRRARQRALARVVAEVGAGWLVLAHTADDQAETILMRVLLRGGTRGLGGMHPVAGTVLRPMLPVRKREILCALQRLGQSFQRDESNGDPRYARGWLRTVVMPVLTGRNPRVVEHLCRLGTLLRDEDTVLDEQARQARDALCGERHGAGGITFECAALRALPPAIRRRVVARIVEEELEVSPASRDVLALDEAVSRQSCRTRRFDLSGGGSAHRSGKLFTVARRAASEAAPPGAEGGGAGAAVITVLPPCRLALPAGAVLAATPPPAVTGAARDTAPWDVVIEVRPAADFSPELARRQAPWQVYLDVDVFAGAAVALRRKQPGDRIHPFGAPGARRLSRLFIETRVPENLRTRVAVMAIGQTVLWVPGLVLAEAARVKPHTKAIAVASITPRV